MPIGDIRTATVDQAFVLTSVGGSAASLVSSSLVSSPAGDEAEWRWTRWLEPHLSGFGDSPVFRYVTADDGRAAVLRGVRGGTCVQALLGSRSELTPAVALTATMWSGWRDDPPAEFPMPRV